MNLGRRRAGLAVGAALEGVAVMALVATVSLAAWSGPDRLAPTAASGRLPRLPALSPQPVGGPADAAPVAALGWQLQAPAVAPDLPRWVYLLPNGDVLVAESDASGLPDAPQGLVARLRALVLGPLGQPGGAASPGAHRISLLRDSDGDGVADLRTVYLEGLDPPLGMALVDGNFYVAHGRTVLRFDYTPGATQVRGPGERVLTLPPSPVDHQGTRRLVASPDGNRLFVTVTEAADNGEGECGRTAGPVRAAFAGGTPKPRDLAAEPARSALRTARDRRVDMLADEDLMRLPDGSFRGAPGRDFGSAIDAVAPPPAAGGVADTGQVAWRVSAAPAP